MAHQTIERRRRQRCVKDVGMHCSLLHGELNQPVTLRNFSAYSLYFESKREIRPGTVIVLRTMEASDRSDFESAADMLEFFISPDDPPVCMRFRSHSLATVQRCVKLDEPADAPLYGIGAEVQILTE